MNTEHLSGSVIAAPLVYLAGARRNVDVVLNVWRSEAKFDLGARIVALQSSGR